MPKKRESQPMQVWLSNTDRHRLGQMASKTGCTRSELAREAIKLMLDESENRLRQKIAIADAGLSFEDFDVSAKTTIARADDQAFQLGYNRIGSEHLLLGVAMDSGLSPKLRQFSLTPNVIKNKILIFLGLGTDTVFDQLAVTANCRRVFQYARKLKNERQEQLIGAEHLLLSLLAQGTGGAYNVLHVIAPDREPIRSLILKSMPPQPAKKSRGRVARS